MDQTTRRGSDQRPGASRSSNSPELQIGSVLADHRIEGELGRGGMGIVYKARHLPLDRPRALKLIAPELAANNTFRKRFVRESRIAASIDHPNVVPVYQAGEEDGQLYLSMREIDGVDLGHLVKAAGALDPSRVIEIVRGIAAGLEAAHATGMVHRDQMFGGPSRDVLRGGPGGEGSLSPRDADVSGDGGADRILQGAGGDSYCAVDDPGRDVISGGSGNDQFCPAADEFVDLFRGGAGEDDVDYSEAPNRPLVASLDSNRNDGIGCPVDCTPDNLGSGIENILAGFGPSTLIGNSRSNRLAVLEDAPAMPASTLIGLGGDDELEGGSGDDSIDGGSGDDRLFGRNGDDSLDGGPDDDRCHGGPDNDTAINCELLTGVP